MLRVELECIAHPVAAPNSECISEKISMNSFLLVSRVVSAGEMAFSDYVVLRNFIAELCGR